MAEDDIPIPEEILMNRPIIYLATAKGNQPRVRPVTLIVDQGDLFVLTGTKDAKVAEIRKNSKVEVIIPVRHGESTGYIRFKAKATIRDELEDRVRAAKAAPFFDNYFQSPEDKGFTLIHFETIHIEYLKPGQNYPEIITNLNLR